MEKQKALLPQGAPADEATSTLQRRCSLCDALGPPSPRFLAQPPGPSFDPVTTKEGQARALIALAETIAAGVLKDPAVCNGLDWVRARKYHKTLVTKAPQCLQAIWQASIFHDHMGGLTTCPLCEEPCTWEHVVFRCNGETRKHKPQTQRFGRGLSSRTARPRSPAAQHKPRRTEFEGVWESGRTIEGNDYFFATDASGGAYTADPRLRRVGVSVVAFKKEGEQLVRMGALRGQVPGRQTVFRGELYAVCSSSTPQGP